MKKESIEQLRARLARDEELQSLVRKRAYEIYKNRAGRPGNAAHDWLQAENEVLVHLIKEESVIRFEAVQESIIPAATQASAPAGSEKKKGGSQPRVRKAVVKTKSGESPDVKPSKPARSKKDSSKASGKRKTKDEKKSK
jgi:hypothetical protein